jgi:protein ImuA
MHAVSSLGSAPEPMSLQQLLADRADLWRGRVEVSALIEGLATGFADLDAALPWGGWPTNGLTEVISDQPGAAFALILPALVRLCAGGGSSSGRQADQDVGPASRSHRDQALPRSQARGWLLLVNPPLIPYAPALVARGLDLGRIVVVDAPAQGAWVMEQGLRLGGCAAVIAWTVTESGRCSRNQDAAWTTPVLRRLQLAAQSCSSPALLLRPSPAAKKPSTALLRLECESSADGLQVVLRKLRGGRAGRRIRLSSFPCQ